MGVEPILNNSFADCSLTVRADVRKEEVKLPQDNSFTLNLIVVSQILNGATLEPSSANSVSPIK